MSALGPGCVKTRTVMVGWGESSWRAQSVSCPDRFHQSANAQKAHHAFHVVGQNVQRHFSPYVLEPFHLEVRRSHPRLYRTEWMLHSLTAQPHLFRVSIEPRLHGLKDAFLLPAR